MTAYGDLDRIVAANTGATRAARDVSAIEVFISTIVVYKQIMRPEKDYSLAYDGTTSFIKLDTTFELR